MARFEVNVHRLQIEEHPDADRLEVATILGYRCVVPKGQYKTGDLAAYIPEQSVVPDKILTEMGLEGRLAGKQKNRVRAQRLRGVLSQGLVYGGRLLEGREWREGDDCTQILGITKYEPPIPPEMSGSLEPYGGDIKLASYDIENVKKYPGRLQDGEQCVMHEKVHGTLCYYTVHTDTGSIRVSSKGRAADQLVFAADGSVDNVYTRMLDRYADSLRGLAGALGGDHGSKDGTVHVLCEAYGRKVQDLTYGTDLDMIVFDVLIPGAGGGGRYVQQSEIQESLDGLDIRPAPLAYRGPYSADALDKYTTGQSLVPGAGHLREGIVVRPVPEREDADGRVILKSVSPEYLCRKGGTEYN